MRMRIFFVFLVSFLVFSCAPPKETKEVRYVYDYPVGSYDYSLVVEGEGKVSYFLFSFSGRLNISAELNLTVFDDKKGKLYVFTLKDVNFRSSMGIDEEVRKFLSKTNIVISFYMNDKGVKYPISESVIEKVILDLLIPVLPETGGTNEVIYGNFGLTIGDTSLNTEISNLVSVFSTNQDSFFVFTTNTLKALELKNVDIVVAEIRSVGSGFVVNNILTDYRVSLNSSTTIPLYMGAATRVVGFKGKANITFYLKNKI